MKKILICAYITIFAISLQAQIKQDEKNQKNYNIYKNIDVFNSVVKEVDMYYVDSVKVDSLINRTIHNMLAGLDPYTEFYSDENIDDLRFMTTGKYAGVGSIISYNNGRVIINEPYKGMPADKAGLKAGDIILEVNGKDMRNANVKEVSDELKGTPGTDLKLKIQRPGETKERVIALKREKIEIDPITHYGIYDNNVGYIHFSSFTNGSSKRVEESFVDLKKRGAESLILDLRGNGGGIMEEAINIINFFVRKGREVVSTKGKVKQWDRVYRTQAHPIDTIIPIAVLIDTGSASASEIVAGALQDLDRAVIIGNRSFGKGLVQTPRELPYGYNMKITTAKYYIPSGRSIQVLDYSHRNSDGSVARVPDSLTNVFKTVNGREVRDGGGITPDFIIPVEQSATIVYYLMADNIIFDFVTDWVQKNPKIASVKEFNLSDGDYDAFKSFVKSKDFKYDQMSIRSLQSLKDIMKFERYFDNAAEEYKALENKLQPNLDRDLELFKKEIRSYIETEIIKRYYYKEGMLIRELLADPVMEKAIEVLKDRQLYNTVLKPKPENMPSAEEIKEKLKDTYL